MLPARVPIRIVADDAHEYQALADVLGGGQCGALVLPVRDEPAMAAIVCPSGDAGAAQGLPRVVLQAQGAPVADNDEAAMRVLYVPVALKDVLGALEALVQDVNAAPPHPRLHNGWVLDAAHLTLTGPGGETVALTDTETRLLSILFDAGGGERTRETLLQRVWGYRPGLDTHTLETHIYRLRQKIETNPTNPQFLMTTENGYRLDDAPS